MKQKTFNRIANTIFWIAAVSGLAYSIAEPIYRNGTSHLKGAL